MKNLLNILFLLLVLSCSKPKSVLICGDHVCVNNDEAQQFFEENLTLEVKIIDKRKSKNFDLVELNLLSNSEQKKEIGIFQKNRVDKNLKVLSNKEIEEKRIEIKRKKKADSIKNKNIAKKNVKVIKENKKLKKIKQTKKIEKENLVSNDKIFDVCLVLKECNITEISKFLVKNGKDKNFPDITKREF